MSEENIDAGIEVEATVEVVVDEVPAPVEVASEPEPIAVAPVVEVIEEVKPEPVPVTPEPVVNTGVVVSGKDVDEVYLAKCVYKNKFERKSLTIHHLQRRLVELGYPDAGTDKDGYLADLTQLAIEKFQEANGLPVGKIDAATFEKIFAGDPHVHVNL